MEAREEKGLVIAAQSNINKTDKGYLDLAATIKIMEARGQGFRIQLIDPPFYRRLRKRFAPLIPHWEYAPYEKL